MDKDKSEYDKQIDQELKAFANRWKNSPYDTPMQMVHAETLEEIKKDSKVKEK